MIFAKVLLFAALSFFSAVGIAEENLTPQKKADIEHFLEITGALSASQQMASLASAQLAQTIRKLRPDIPEEIISVLPEEVDAVFAANLDSFKETMIPLYHKHFTSAEIREMTRFYKTDLGKKMIQVMPSLISDSMELGQRWGQSLGPQIDARIKARFRKEGVSI